MFLYNIYAFIAPPLPPPLPPMILWKLELSQGVQETNEHDVHYGYDLLKFKNYALCISVRYYPFHPAVLTRPSPTTTAAPPRTTTPATTTPDPPEQEQEESGTTWHTSGSFLTHALTTAYFGTTDGGGENEWEEDMTTQSFWIRPTRGYNRRLETTTTTPSPTTTETTEEPPENEAQGQGQGHSSSHEPRSGLCFCTPFEYCPRGSIPRGGLCWDMSWYARHPYIRCCYRPSLARRLHSYHDIEL